MTNLPALAEARHQLVDRDLVDATRAVLTVLQQAEAAAVSLVAEAEDRGIITASTAAGAAQWVQRLSAWDPDPGLAVSGSEALLPDVAQHAEVSGTGRAAIAEGEPDSFGGDATQPRPRVPGLEPSAARRIARLAQACQSPTNGPVLEALSAGRVGVSACLTAIEQVDPVHAVLPEASREEILSWFLELPPESGRTGIRELTRRIIATYGGPAQLDDAEKAQDPYETVTFTDLPDGMVEFIARLTHAHAQEVKHALSALSAPSPRSTCCDNPFHRHTGSAADLSSRSMGEPDLRTPGKRCADALMALVGLGAAAADADGEFKTTGSARLVVTIDHQVLSGLLAGAGFTEAGTTIDATTIRRMACDADLIPLVLGADSQPLDVGRSQRLVTPAIRAAVIQRDQHCTFPGCTRPPAWCEVHHLIPWWCGGATSVANSGLLCRRHHTIVHSRRLAAVLTTSGVVWDLRPGRMSAVPNRSVKAASSEPLADKFDGTSACTSPPRTGWATYTLRLAESVRADSSQPCAPPPGDCSSRKTHGPRTRRQPAPVTSGGSRGRRHPFRPAQHEGDGPVGPTTRSYSSCVASGSQRQRVLGSAGAQTVWRGQSRGPPTRQFDGGSQSGSALRAVAGTDHSHDRGSRWV